VLAAYIAIFLLNSCTTQQVTINSLSRRTIVCNSKNLPHMQKLPVYKNGWQIVDSCYSHLPHSTALAIVVFENEWMEEFGRSQKVLDVLTEILVEWSSERRYVSGYFNNGIPYKDLRVSGLALGPKYVGVYTETDVKLCKTSLVHELVHVAIRAENGKHGDADHEGPRYKGWTRKHTKFIKKTNKILCEIGL
jgi:hypothetical protein